jgi:hypothetical protein
MTRQYLRETPEGAIEAWPCDLTALRAEGIHAHDRTDVRSLAKHRVQIVHQQTRPADVPRMVWELEPTPQKRGQFWTREWVQRAMTAGELATWREGMVVSRLTGRLVLGEAVCKQLDAMATAPVIPDEPEFPVGQNLPWAMRQAILHADVWRRTSSAMDELGYLMGYSDAQKDDLFLAAMAMDG